MCVCMHICLSICVRVCMYVGMSVCVNQTLTSNRGVSSVKGEFNLALWMLVRFPSSRHFSQKSGPK